MEEEKIIRSICEQLSIQFYENTTQWKRYELAVTVGLRNSRMKKNKT